MSSPKVGTPKQEAQKGFAEQVVRIYRDHPEVEFTVDAYPMQDDQFICVSARFPSLPDQEAWVPLEIGHETWSADRQSQLIHEFTQVTNKRLDLERIASQYIRSRVQEAIDAYR